MADNDNVSGVLPPELANQLDPSVLDLIAKGGSGKPQSPLQGQVADAQAQQAAPTPQPNPNVPTSQDSSTSGLPPAITNVIASMGKAGVSSATDDTSKYPQVKGGLNPQQAAAQKASNPMGVPRPKIGGLPGLIMDMINPNRGVAPGQAAPSKLDHFNDFLTNFLQSMSAGFANEGHGPGSAMRGAAAAMQAPYQQSLQQYGAQQEAQKNQAQISSENARTELTKAQTQQTTTTTPVRMIDGTTVYIPNKDLASYLKGHEGATARVEASENAADAKLKTQNQVNKVLGEAADALKNGDIKGYQAKLKQAGEMAQAAKPIPVKNNESEWIDRLNKDPNDKIAAANLKKLQDRRKELMEVRGESMGKGRLYLLRNYLNKETGQIESLTGFQYLANKGDYEPAGQISGDKVIAVQQLQSEAAPAIKQMGDSLGAFDNEADKLIFAKIMKGVGSPPAGDEHTWLNNVANQVATSNLSQKGKDLMISEARMAETLGRMRGVLGLQATDSAMALTLGLMSGYSTPDSKYARKQLNTIDDMINKAVEIPALGGRGGLPERMQKGNTNSGVTAHKLLQKYPPPQQR